ncbi:MAG: serine/threonine protein kinase, partial [Planctomycetota bacterium]
KNPKTADDLRARLSTLARLGMLPDASEDDSETATIGPYLVLRTLGYGGMSRVYVARHQDDGGLVALKVLNAPIHGDERAHLRFEREVQAVSTLSHPCIVKVHGSGIDEGRPWLAMEYVEGATLDRLLEELRADGVRFDELDGAHVRAIVQRGSETQPSNDTVHGYVESLCRIVLDIAEALEHAHRYGIVHRDVKPANIVIGLDGRAKLLDLGLATLEGSPSLTRTGDFAGTPYYVSPEQAKSVHDADGRSDVFSLAVTLYEALTLRRPFEGENAAQVFRNLMICDPVPPARLNPLLPRDLETICLHALERNPDRRYSSMSEFATDLQRFLEFKPVVAQPISRLRRARRLTRRHTTLTLFLATSVVFLVGAPIVLALFIQALQHERDVARENEIEADQQADLSQAVVDHLVELFLPSAEYAGTDQEWGWEEMISASVDRIPHELQEEPLLRAALLEAGGRIHANLDRTQEAVPLFDRAYALRQRQLEGDDPQLAISLVWLSRAHLDAGNLSAALSLASRGLEALERNSDNSRTGPAFDLRLTLAKAAGRAGDTERALTELNILEAVCMEHPRELLDRSVVVHGTLADLFLAEGNFDLAHDSCDRAIALLRKAWVPDARLLAFHLRLRARIQLAQENPQAAERTHAEADDLASAFGLAQHGLPGDQWIASYPFQLLPAWSADYAKTFQEGITGLQAGHASLAIQAFERCLEWAPQHPVCLYNLACALTLGSQHDAALERLEEARQNHFGKLQGNLASLANDPDLRPLHGLARYKELKQRMRASSRAAELRHASPRTYVPPGEKHNTLLVVLTGDQAATPDGRYELWKKIAEECDAALFCMEGLLAGEPSSWIDETGDFLSNPWSTEELPARLVSDFAREEDITSGRVVLIGEGSGATIAFDLALRAPGFFGSVLLLDGVPTPPRDATALALARACGLRFRLILGEACAPGDLLFKRSPQDIVGELGPWLARGELQASAEMVGGRAGELPSAHLVLEIQRLLSD